ncbi:MAG: peptidase S10 [Azospirillaceae bacterium]|nr:peptidase S10 [Azospirillaceae bacterium]
MPSLTRRQSLLGAAVAALTLKAAGSAQAQEAAPAVAPLSGGPFVTRHTGTFNGESVAYTATVGETVVAGPEGAPGVRFITTSYVRDGADTATRPVLFLFNGGPSVASATLHMVGLGPKRIAVAQDPAQPQPDPQPVVDNAESVLDAADLVFIDPAETGFSRIQPGGKRDYFYSAFGDAQSVADFIAAWVKANGREASPKFVLGESYGTIRAALVAGRLSKVMPLDGVCLFGQAVNMIETSQRRNNIVSYALNITALAAIAAYHGKADRRAKSMAAFIEEAYAWGTTEYLQALFKGQALSPAERQHIALRLQAFTGISADYYLANRLIISKMAFSRELLRDQGKIMGIYDARYVGPAPAPGQRAHDPFAPAIAAVGSAMRDHLAQDLGVTWPGADYREAAPDVDGWLYNVTASMGGGPFEDYDYPADLSKAFQANPKFRLLVGTGIYDLTTTVGPARYLVSRSDYPADRVFLRQFEGGHVSYTNDPARKALAADVRAFVTGGKPA